MTIGCVWVTARPARTGAGPAGVRLRAGAAAWRHVHHERSRISSMRLEISEAVDAWRSVGAGRLSGDDLLGAVDPALAAGETEQAASWLDTYRDRGER